MAGSEHSWKLSFARPRLRARAIRKAKSLNLQGFGARLEVELRKICTTPARENGLEVKIVKNWRFRGDVFGGSKCFFRVASAGILARCKIHGRHRGSWGLQKTLAGVVDLKRLWNDVFRVRGRRRDFVLCVSMFNFQPTTQNPWNGCKFYVTEVVLSRDHFAWQLQEFACLGSTFSWRQAQYFWSIRSKIVKTYWNSEVRCLVDMSFLKEVSQKRFVFEL